MEFERTASRLWRHLPRPERLEASAAFWKEPPQEALAEALAGIVKTRRLRPQVARSLSEAAKAEALATILDPGEAVAAALIVALHLKSRRPLLVAFLNAVGIPNENGLIQDAEPTDPPSEEKVRAGLEALKDFPPEHVALYLNVLLMQDPDRWGMLPRLVGSK